MREYAGQEMPTLIDRIAFPRSTINKPAPPPANVKRINIGDPHTDFLYYVEYLPQRVVRSASTSLVSSNACISEPASFLSAETYVATIAYFHSNAETLLTVQTTLQRLSNAMNVRILSFEYPGYGIARYQGYPSQAACEAAFEHIPKHFKYDIVWGRSIGGYFATYVAYVTQNSRPQTRIALILESAVSSAFYAIGSTKCISCFPFRDYFIVRRLTTYLQSASVLIIHGSDDTIIPLRCALDNFSAFCGGGTQGCLEGLASGGEFDDNAKHLAILDGAGHNDLAFGQTTYYLVLQEFVRQLTSDATYRIDLDLLSWGPERTEVAENCVL